MVNSDPAFVSPAVLSEKGEVEQGRVSMTADSIRSNNPVQKTRTAQDWDGPDDPENPMNWPRWRKLYTVLMAGLQSFTM